MTDVQIVIGGLAEVDDAAQIWAEATTARDGQADVPPLDIARPIIASVIEKPGALLLLAIQNDGRAVGFAAMEPMSEVSGRADAAEVRYLGVRPACWGAGVGSQILDGVAEQLRQAGFTNAQLAVYSDNAAAVRLYERMGWRPYGSPTPHPRTGRPEQTYRLILSAAGSER